MRIRSQIMLATIPIFLIMGLIAGGANYKAQLQELNWSMEERLRALTVCLTLMVRDEHVQAPKGDANFDPLPHIATINDLLVLSIWDDSGKVLYSWSTPKTRSEPIPLPSGSPAASSFTILRREDSPGSLTFIASQGFTLPSGKKALLGISLDGTPILTRSRGFLRHITTISLAAVLFGLLSSWFLGWLITRPVHQLGTAANLVAMGNFSQHIEESPVREINDLTNTFNTMSNVLDGVLHRSKRNLIESEMFRTPTDMAFHLLDGVGKKISFQAGIFQIAGRRLGRNFREFMLCREHSSSPLLLLGTLAETDPLQAALTLQALPNLLDLVAGDSPQACIRKFLNLVRTSSAQAWFWEGTHWCVFTWNGASLAEGRMEAQDIQFLHNTAIDEEMLASLIKLYPQDDAEQMGDRIAAIFSEQKKGVIFAIRRRANANL
jgi:HAMP domain-containing protein